MDRDAARAVAQRAVRERLALHGRRHVAVFDDDDLAVLQTEVADLLLGIGLRDHLARHLGLRVEVETDERRVDATHQRVVHLEVTERVDVLGLHQVERATAVQRAQRAAVPVRAQRERVLRLEQDLAVETHGRHAALAEKVHAVRIQAEKLVLRKERLRLRVIRVAGHDEPVQRLPVARAGGLDFLGEHLEERLLLDRRDGKRALGPVVTEACPLPARHRESGDATRAQRRLALRAGAGPRRGITAVGRQHGDRRRCQAGEVHPGGAVGLEDERAVEPVDFREVDLARLRREFGATGGIKLVPEGEYLALVGGAEGSDQIVISHWSIVVGYFEPSCGHWLLGFARIARIPPRRVNRSTKDSRQLAAFVDCGADRFLTRQLRPQRHL